MDIGGWLRSLASKGMRRLSARTKSDTVLPDLTTEDSKGHVGVVGQRRTPPQPSGPRANANRSWAYSRYRHLGGTVPAGASGVP
jgi:hypothetical protein